MKIKNKREYPTGKVVYTGGCHEVICDGYNHYAVSYDSIEIQCGCFCNYPKFLDKGFVWDLIKTPINNNQIQQDVAGSLEWVNK